jgi:uncharacterized protein (UPF0264 family)
VSGPVLREIAACLPASVPLSVALGDPRDRSALAVAMAVFDGIAPRPSPVYMKIGLSGAGSGAEALLCAAIAAAAGMALRPTVIAVAYADHVAARVPAPEIVTRLARSAGADGVLMDTWGKGAGDLFHHIDRSRLGAWVGEAKAAGLLVALAGSLANEGVRAVAELGADIVGVRGAACVGGRSGTVATHRVAALKVALRRAAEALDLVP